MKKYFKIINDQVVFFKSNVLEVENEDNGFKYIISIINPTEEQILKAGWQIYEPTEEENLAEIKSRKLLEIAEYDKSDNVESFTINGNQMWLDHTFRQQIRTSADAYTALGMETMTKVFNGQEFTFAISMWIQMLNALEVYAAEALNTTERHKNAVRNLNTVQEVEAYDITSGYPEKLNFTT